MTDRKLVTVRRIDEVIAHPNADLLELVRIDGWQVVVKKGEFKPGDDCLFFEIDSFIPLDDSYDAFDFLKKNAIKFNDVEGARIKTIRLRKELSQGLALPLSAFSDVHYNLNYDTTGHVVEGERDDNFDYAPVFSVVKYEKPLAANLSGKVKGHFPSFIHKTDQERIQNIWNKFGGKRGDKKVTDYTHPTTGEVFHSEKDYDYYKDDIYEITTKLDGSSMTAYLKDGVFGVCSRNYDLEETEGNAFWQAARKYDLEKCLRDSFNRDGSEYAFQGELIGPGIQDNNEKLTENEFYIFDVFDIKEGKYLDAFARLDLVRGYYNLPVVPHVAYLKMTGTFNNLNDILEYAEGPSLNPYMPREGVVFKSMIDPNVSFKAISNTYLERTGQ